MLPNTVVKVCLAYVVKQQSQLICHEETVIHYHMCCTGLCTQRAGVAQHAASAHVTFHVRAVVCMPLLLDCSFKRIQLQETKHAPSLIQSVGAELALSQLARAVVATP